MYVYVCVCVCVIVLAYSVKMILMKYCTVVVTGRLQFLWKPNVYGHVINTMVNILKVPVAKPRQAVKLSSFCTVLVFGHRTFHNHIRSLIH